MKIFKGKYKALGFVEALIAIAVAGISSLVLMNIAISTINQVLRNEMDNTLTSEAIEGASLVKKIASNHNASKTSLFPKIEGNVNSCFLVTGGTQSPEFQKVGTDYQSVCNYDSDRDSCLGANSGGELFRVFCFLPDSVSDSGLVVGKIVTGLSDCPSSANTGKCKINDYEYYLGVKVDQNY